MLDSLSRMPFIDSAELAGVLGEVHATVHLTIHPRWYTLAPPQWANFPPLLTSGILVEVWLAMAE